MKSYYYGKLFSHVGLRKYGSHIFFLVTCLLVNFFVSSHVSALTVSPVKAELFSDPGEVLQSEMSLLNEQNQTMTFYSSFENFEPQGESGTPNFVPGKEGLTTWIKAPVSITLAPQEKQTIPFSITVPSDAEPGGHFAAIFWSATPSEPEANLQQVAVGAKIGTLILLKVSGDIKEGGGVVDFATANKKTWFTTLPITFTYRFQNSGADRVKPLGAVTIKNIFGITSATINANVSEGNVLPVSTRKFTIVWTGHQQEQGNDSNLQAPVEEDKNSGFFAMAKKEWDQFAFGQYTAHLQVNYGGSNEAKATYKFFIVPWQLFIIVFIVLAVLLAVVFFGIKKYNRWIISHASQHL